MSDPNVSIRNDTHGDTYDDTDDNIHGTIRNGIMHVMREHLQIPHAVLDTIDHDTHLIRHLQLDSLKQLTLVVELENHFKICFEPGDEHQIETMGDVMQLIAQRLILHEAGSPLSRG